MKGMRGDKGLPGPPGEQGHAGNLFSFNIFSSLTDYFRKQFQLSSYRGSHHEPIILIFTIAFDQRSCY